MWWLGWLVCFCGCVSGIEKSEEERNEIIDSSIIFRLPHKSTPQEKPETSALLMSVIRLGSVVFGRVRKIAWMRETEGEKKWNEKQMPSSQKIRANSGDDATRIIKKKEETSIQ